MAEDPLGAIDAFMVLKPEEVTNDPRKEMMAHLAEDADFEAVSGRFPDDSRSLALEVRREMLRRWAGFDPRAAADFVARAEGVSPGQIGVVARRWLEREDGGEELAAWLDGEEAAAGGLRDAALESLAEGLVGEGRAAEAWPWAARALPLERRVELATAVFLEWEKSDREAAVAAWVELFPPGVAEREEAAAGG